MEKNVSETKRNMKTKKCKYCKSEIPHDARICPVCKKKQGTNGCLLVIEIVVISFIIFVALIGMSGNKNENKEEVSEKKVFGIGDTVENNGIEVTLISAESNAGNAYLKPGEGKMFEVLEFEISNNSEHDIVVSSLTAFEAYCDDYAANFDIRVNVLYNDKEQLDGNVADGKKIKGVIGYEVPTDFKKLEITCKPSFWSSYSVQYEVMNEQ